MAPLSEPKPDPELIARALAYLNRAFLGGCAQSCERAAYCLDCLARDQGSPEPVREACAHLSETLWAWSTMRLEERVECAPWLRARPGTNPGPAGA